MKQTSSGNLYISDNYLTYFFYTFMFVCGFVAGTQIWTLPSVNFTVPGFIQSSSNYSDIFAAIAIPQLSLLVLFIIFALFAGGWLLMPLIIYSVGATYGFSCCSFFSDILDRRTWFVAILAVFSHICSLIVILYFCVYSHKLSRQLSGLGTKPATAYIAFIKSAVLSLFVILFIAVLFSGLIFLIQTHI